MESVHLAVLEEENSAVRYSSGGGAQTNNINSRSGQQIINNAPVGIQNINPVIKQKEDFSFRKPVGICLGQAPYIDPALFIGRQAEINEMKEALKLGNSRQSQQRVVLGGMGGVGKTQLAIAYVQHDNNKYDSVFWLNATSETTLKDSFRKIAESIFDIQEPDRLDGEQSSVQIRRWLSDPRNTRWLAVFDNYDDPDQFSIEKYLPLASHGAIIVTTRRPDRVAGRKIQIRPLSDVAEGLEILQTRSHRETVKSDPHAKRLAERLAGLPLALVTAGAYLHQSTFSFERYLQEYERRWNIDPRRPVQLQEYQDRTLYTTWDLSYMQLEDKDPSAAKMLRLLAYFDNQSVWYELFHVGLSDDSPPWLHEVMIDDISFESVMRTLADYCFVNVQTALSAWSTHTCVHDWTLAVLNKTVDARQYWYAFDCVGKSINAADWHSLAHPSKVPLTAHAVRLLHRSLFRDSDLEAIPYVRLASASLIALLLTEQSHPTHAERMYLGVRVACHKHLGSDDFMTILMTNSLGDNYLRQGNLAAAEIMHQQALAHCDANDLESRSSLVTLSGLGLLYLAQGKLTEAESVLSRALLGQNRLLGPEDPSTLNTVHDLGAVFDEQGRYNESEELYLQALAGFKKVLGPDNFSTLKTTCFLGILYDKQDKLTEAEQMYICALAGFEKILGLDRKSTLHIAYALGKIYHKQDKLTEAEQMYLRVLAGYEKKLGPHHKLTLSSIDSLGILYRKQDRLVEAEQMYVRLLAGRKETLGLDHALTLEAAHILGNLYHDQGKRSEAEEIYIYLIARLEGILGSDHK